MSDSFGTRWVNALRSEWIREGYPRRPQPAAGRRRAAFKPSAPSGWASAASGCGRTGITRLRQLRRGIAATCSVREKREMCSLRRGRNVILPGQYYDAESGLNYNYFRDFDPATGRYIESDPIGLNSGSYSTYAYVGNNPLSNIDPTGQNPAAIGIGIGVGIGVGAIICSVLPSCWQGLEQTLDDLLNPPPSPESPAIPTQPPPLSWMHNPAANAHRDRPGCPDPGATPPPDCKEERNACAELCADAQTDPDLPHVFAGSMAECMKSCLPPECGGHPRWMGGISK